jgi:hypothetical protein
MDKNAIEARAKALQPMMTVSAYQSSYIKDDSQTLISMLATWQKTKQINTSNSEGLIEKTYASAKIYQQTNAGKGAYFVQAEYQTRPIYIKDPYMMQATYDISMIGNKVASLAMVGNESVVKGADNGK